MTLQPLDLHANHQIQSPKTNPDFLFNEQGGARSRTEIDSAEDELHIFSNEIPNVYKPEVSI